MVLLAHGCKVAIVRLHLAPAVDLGLNRSDFLLQRTILLADVFGRPAAQ